MGESAAETQEAELGVIVCRRTIRWTRAAGTCFASSFLEFNGVTSAQPRELHRSAAETNSQQMFRGMDIGDSVGGDNEASRLNRV